MARAGAICRPDTRLRPAPFRRPVAPVGDITVKEAPAAGMRTPSTLVPVTQNRDWRIYDWAERHAACVALMKSRQPEIVMLGDSITHFWGGEPVGGRRTGAAEWDRFFAGRRVVNLGYGWDRTENVLWRLMHGEFDHVKPEGRRRDDWHQQHRTEHARRDCGRYCRYLRRTASACTGRAHFAARHLPAQCGAGR